MLTLWAFTGLSVFVKTRTTAEIPAAGRQHGVATPTVERLDAMIAEMEQGRRDFSQDNLAELGR